MEVETDNLGSPFLLSFYGDVKSGDSPIFSALNNSFFAKIIF